MEINVGDYVRFKKETYVDYLICKIVKIDYNASFQFCYTRPLVYFDNNECIYLDELKEMIIKHSKDIINLIEVGDYVNGKQVLKIWTEPFGELVGMTLIELYGEKEIPTIRNIKSILTHEQFEANAYKIEKEV